MSGAQCEDEFPPSHLYSAVFHGHQRDEMHLQSANDPNSYSAPSFSVVELTRESPEGYVPRLRMCLQLRPDYDKMKATSLTIVHAPSSPPSEHSSGK